MHLMLMLFFSFEGKACDGANVPIFGGRNNVFNSCYFSLLIQYAVWRGISSKLAVKIYPTFTFVHITFLLYYLLCYLLYVIYIINEYFY